MKKPGLLILSVIALISLSQCTKEIQFSEGNPIPSIVLSETLPLEVVQFKDSLKLTIAYEDGDGDLGFENADINSLEIQDTRLAKPDYYYVPPQAPLDSKIHIKGTLKVNIKSLFLLGAGSIETTTLVIRIRDRAGNWSNKVTTPQITIKK